MLMSGSISQLQLNVQGKSLLGGLVSGKLINTWWKSFSPTTACPSQRMQHSRADEMAIRPLEQKKMKSSVLKKWKVEPKHAILTENAFAKDRRLSRDMNPAPL
jgi:hypothetical protein